MRSSNTVRRSGAEMFSGLWITWKLPGRALPATRRGTPVWQGAERPANVSSVAGEAGRHADVAQLVAHHLAKVRVAGSNPVVRSERGLHRLRVRGQLGGVAERRGNGLQSRVHGFKSRLHLATQEDFGRLAQRERAS